MAVPAANGSRGNPLFGRISMRNLLIAQVLAMIAATIVLIVGPNPWIALGVAAGVGLIPLIPIGRRVLLDWVATWWKYRGNRAYRIGDSSDFRGPDDRSLGLYWDESRVVAVVEVLPPPGGLTRIDRTAVHASHLLPMAELATCLAQHDILLSGIDIISHGHRSRSGTPAGAIYESLLGPLPATAHRTVWLAIGFDMVDCPGAAARRGGGDEGAARSVTIATQRIVRTLDDAGCASRVLTASEIRSAVRLVIHGEDARELTHRWRYAELGNSVNIGAAIDPNRLGSEILSQLWVAESRGTTVAVRLRPGSSANTVRVGAAWRSTLRELPETTQSKNMVSMHGRHRDSLLAHLPIGVPDLEDTVPTAEYAIEVLEVLALPSSGCGQMIGSDDEGNGVALRIVGAGISSVYVAGELYLAQQLVFRALAVGERILVRTNRPHGWHQLIETIGNAERLTLAVETHQSDAGFTATVVDGVLAPAPHAGITTIYVTGDPMGWPATKPDLSIQQPGAIGSRVVLRTSTTQIPLNLVSIPREHTYIGEPRTRQAAPEGRPVPTGQGRSGREPQQR